jgi:hypothetical protein
MLHDHESCPLLKIHPFRQGRATAQEPTCTLAATCPIGPHSKVTTKK